MKKLVLVDRKKKEFYTDEVLFRYRMFDRVGTFIRVDKLAEQFKEGKGLDPIAPEKLSELLSEAGVVTMNVKGHGESIQLAKDSIDKLKSLFEDDIIDSLNTNLICIRKVLERLKDLKVYKVQNSEKHMVQCITTEDLSKLTFCDNPWTNVAEILFELSTRRENNNKTLTIRSEKVTYVTPTGVREFCKNSGVADPLMVDDIINRIHKEK